MVKPVAPAETVKPPSPLLEKGDYLRQRFESLHAITRIVTSAGMRPSRVAFFGAGAEQNYIRATLRPAGTFQGDVERKQNSWKAVIAQNPRWPRATARAIWPVT